MSLQEGDPASQVSFVHEGRQRAGTHTSLGTLETSASRAGESKLRLSLLRERCSWLRSSAVTTRTSYLLFCASLVEVF